MAELNIYSKLAKMRVCLKEKNPVMTGENKYSNFKYYELSDFLPYCNEIADKYNVTCIYQMQENRAVLMLINCDNVEDKIEFSLPLSEVSIKGAMGIQNIGGLATYTRRYLYLIAWEISENDEFDPREMRDKKAEEDTKAEEHRKKQEEIAVSPIGKSKVITIEKELARTGLDVESFCNRFKIDSIEELTESKYPIAMNALRATATKAGFED